jgi:hypothetical protein
MRLKDKLADRSNASSEVEYHGAWGQLIGEPGKGVKTIIEMVQATRLDCILGSAGHSRRALQVALNHVVSGLYSLKCFVCVCVFFLTADTVVRTCESVLNYDWVCVSVLILSVCLFVVVF